MAVAVIIYTCIYIYMSRIFKGNMRTWTDTIKLTDKEKLRSKLRNMGKIYFAA